MRNVDTTVTACQVSEYSRTITVVALGLSAFVFFVACAEGVYVHQQSGASVLPWSFNSGAMEERLCSVAVGTAVGVIASLVGCVVLLIQSFDNHRWNERVRSWGDPQVHPKKTPSWCYASVIGMALLGWSLLPFPVTARIGLSFASQAALYFSLGAFLLSFGSDEC